VTSLRSALVIGARGLVGSALVEALGPGRWTGTYARRPADGLHRLDLAEIARDPSLAREAIDRADPSAVFQAGGLSSVEACEGDEAAASAQHSVGTSVLAVTCARLGIPLVLFSPDVVFDGASGPYAEDAETSPMGVLGRVKRAGEVAALKASARNLVLRTAWVFGPEPGGEGIAYRMARALGAGRQVPAASDLYSTPTYSRDLARAAVALVENGDSGVVHVAGPETMNVASFAMLVAARAQASPSLVKPVAAATLGMAALRPKWGGLRSDRLGKMVPGFALRPPAAALDHWMKNQRGALWPF
jgi:dTDP-4-dehydrorhamnose reductase